MKNLLLNTVRERSKAIVDLLMDEEKLEVERKKAKQNYKKYVGMGNEPATSGFGSDDFDDAREKRAEKERTLGSSSSSDSFRPRAASGSRSSATAASTSPTPSSKPTIASPPTQSLLDFDDTPTSKPSVNDFFGDFPASSSAQPPTASVQSNAFQPSFEANFDAFDPRGNGQSHAAAPQSMQPLQPLQPMQAVQPSAGTSHF
jgi:hypothetical protein